MEFAPNHDYGHVIACDTFVKWRGKQIESSNEERKKSERNPRIL